MSSSPHDKKAAFENPVGGDQPLVKFDVPLWQVFTALFLIAIVLTAFKWYERTYIAPFKPVMWAEFSLANFHQERLNRRNILLWIDAGKNVKESSNSGDEQSSLVDLFESKEVRSAIFLNRCLTWKISLGENFEELVEQDEELASWLRKNLKDVDSGGIGLWTAADKRPEFLPNAAITRESLISLIEGND